MKAYAAPKNCQHFEKDPDSKPVEPGMADGVYVYVQALDGVVWAILDRRQHQHPTILGGKVEVLYAGDFEIQNNIVIHLTNCSGTFQPDDPEGLRRVARAISKQGLRVANTACKFFSWSYFVEVLIIQWQTEEP